MDFNNEEDRTPINFDKTRKTVNKNHFAILISIILLVVLVVLLFIFIFLDTTEDVDSTKVEIQLSYSDVKVNETLKCSASSDAINDADKIKLSYKKSKEKFYSGDPLELMNDDGSTKEVDDKDKIPGVDLVIEGITDKVYAYVEYSTGGEDCDGVKYYSSQAKDGKVVIPFNSREVTSASVYIYSTDENCNKLLKNYSIEIPMYNKISENDKCNSLEGKDSAYCSEYTYSKYDESVLDKLGEKKKEPIKVNIPAIVILFVLFIAAGVVLYIKFN